MRTTLNTFQNNKWLIVFLPLFWAVALSAQVTIKPAPREGFEERIRMTLDTLPVVDTHEHLTSIRSLSKDKTLDFMWLFHQYADDDIKAAGMSKPQFTRLMSDSITVSEKWEILQPFYEASFNTAYNRVTLLSVDHLFGVKEFNEKTILQLTDQLREVYQTDWYHTVLRDKCNIQFVINDSRPIPGNPDFFRYTTRFDYFQLDSKAKIEELAREHGTAIASLDDLNATLRKHFESAVREGLTTIKNSSAYYRSLYYEDVSHERAEEVFRQVMASGDAPLDPETAKPLADYMMHRVLDLAREFKKPVQIHTGLQAGDGNYVMNANPALLANLFLKYRDVRFVIFHGGYPYGGEFGSLAKNFRNVYIDLCWLYIISPSYSERYLHEWLETVPANKILAFGGDYENVENVYGHLLFAKEIIGNVLIEKVKSRYFTEEEALKVARMILHDNAVKLFDLKH